jgi:hypothetical protein
MASKQGTWDVIEGGSAVAVRFLEEEAGDWQTFKLSVYQVDDIQGGMALNM